MPSTSQGQSAGAVPNPMPESAEQHGENPGRFLIEDLNVDAGDGTTGELILGRIRGLETIALCRFWLGIERYLADQEDRDPRDRVVDALNDREETLRKRGEGLATSNTSPEERRRRGEQLAEEHPERVESCAVLVGPEGDERSWTDQAVAGATVRADR